MTERVIIERLMLKVEEVRKAQTYYFKNRTETNKRLALAKEKDLDDYVKQLRKQGYHPDHHRLLTEQTKIF